jgi:hypothetical protein
MRSKVVKRRNSGAAALADQRYRPRRTKNLKRYTRKGRGVDRGLSR